MYTFMYKCKIDNKSMIILFTNGAITNVNLNDISVKDIVYVIFRGTAAESCALLTHT